MNPRRGITATVAAVRRRRRSGEARAIRRSSGECRHEAASAREDSVLRGFVKRNPTNLKKKQKAAILSRSSRLRAVASQTLTACHFLLRANCGGVGGYMRCMYTLSIHPPSARPRGREHGSQDKGAAFRPLQALFVQ